VENRWQRRYHISDLYIVKIGPPPGGYRVATPVRTTARRRSRKAAYHHGDLQRALVDAGLAIVRRQGVEALSLRAVARKVKVSHSAPYHHFGGKAELLAAVAAAGFDLLVETIGQTAAAAMPKCALDGLRAVGAGYLGFALRDPAVFRLMFRPELTQPAEHPVLLEAEARAFGKLIEALMMCQSTGELPGKDPMPLAAICWSTVHGLAMLHVEQVLRETPLVAIPIEELAQLVNEAAINAARPRLDSVVVPIHNTVSLVRNPLFQLPPRQQFRSLAAAIIE
jgi:AcrR family transcriptional regulator